MKNSLLALVLAFAPCTFAGTIAVQCNGNIGVQQVGATLQFGNGISVQDIARVTGTVFSMQLSADNGSYDMLILKNSVDQAGKRSLSSFVVGHGATELDYIDNDKQTTIVCILNQ
jgi:hypothetical protein